MLCNQRMTDREKMKRIVKKYREENEIYSEYERYSWFSEDELIDLCSQANEIVIKNGGEHISAFDNLIFEKSFEKGCPKARFLSWCKQRFII